MSKIQNFEQPTQVIFWDYDGDHYCAGIAFNDFVICACCGGVFPTSEIYEFAPTSVKYPIIPFDDWKDITDDLVGSLNLANLPEFIAEYEKQINDNPDDLVEVPSYPNDSE